MRTIILIWFSLIISISCQKKTPEIGLQLYSLRNQFEKDVPGTLALIKEMGIHEIEGGGTYDYPMEEFQKMLADNELKMVSVGIDYNQLMEDPQPAIDNAKAFGAKYIVCFWIPHPGDTFTIEHTQKAIEVFNTAGKKISDSGLSFCYHAHGFEFRPY
jgi:sugar phosphate isomerase/epimerase